MQDSSRIEVFLPPQIIKLKDVDMTNDLAMKKMCGASQEYLREDIICMVNTLYTIEFLNSQKTKFSFLEDIKKAIMALLPCIKKPQRSDNHQVNMRRKPMMQIIKHVSIDILKRITLPGHLPLHIVLRRVYMR